MKVTGTLFYRHIPQEKALFNWGTHYLLVPAGKRASAIEHYTSVPVVDYPVPDACLSFRSGTFGWFERHKTPHHGEDNRG